MFQRPTVYVWHSRLFNNLRLSMMQDISAPGSINLFHKMLMGIKELPHEVFFHFVNLAIWLKNSCLDCLQYTLQTGKAVYKGKRLKIFKDKVE